MPDIGEAIDALSLFAGVLGFLFANWATETDVVLSRGMPKHYADRKPYIDSLASSLIYKIIPLSLLTIMFVYSQIGVFISILSESDFYVPVLHRVEEFSAGRTIFVIVFIALSYFMLATITFLVRLVKAIAAAQKGRTENQPRIHRFG